MKSGCSCPGSTVVYECGVEGSGLTLWEVAECSGDEAITLSSSNFVNSDDVCMNGEVLGRGISEKDNCYISTLTLNVSESLSDEVVMCFLDNGTMAHLIGNSTLSVATG